MPKSYVYFLKLKGEAIIKIGKANDVLARVSQLAGVHAFDLLSSFVLETVSVDDAYHIEGVFHKIFQNNNVPRPGDGGTEFFHNSVLKEIPSLVDILTRQYDCALIDDYFDNSLIHTTTTEITRILHTIGGRLRTIRLRRNISQQDLATSISVSLNTVKALEKGRGKLETMVSAMLALGHNEVVNFLANVDITNRARAGGKLKDSARR